MSSFRAIVREDSAIDETIIKITQYLDTVAEEDLESYKTGKYLGFLQGVLWLIDSSCENLEEDE